MPKCGQNSNDCSLSAYHIHSTLHEASVAESLWHALASTTVIDPAAVHVVDSRDWIPTLIFIEERLSIWDYKRQLQKGLLENLQISVDMLQSVNMHMWRSMLKWQQDVAPTWLAYTCTSTLIKILVKIRLWNKR